MGGGETGSSRLMQVTTVGREGMSAKAGGLAGESVQHAGRAGRQGGRGARDAAVPVGRVIQVSLGTECGG